MSKKSGKIISLTVMILVLIVVLTASTYAWFTTNQTIEATGIDVKARVSQKIQISTDAINWKSAITLYDILNASYETGRLNQVPNNFQAYSTAGYLTNGLIDMYHGFVSLDKNSSSETYGKKVLTTEKVLENDGVNGGFLAFDLYLKNDIATSIYLGKKSYVKYVLEDKGIENTIRVGFVVEGTLPSGSSTSDIQNLKTNDISNVIIWEANSNAHTDKAIIEAKKTYDLDITNDNATLPYYGVKSEISTPVLLTSTNEEYFALLENNICTSSNYKTENDTNKLLFHLPVGITKIRVYAWVEGQDVDCENNAAGSDFEFNFNFTTKIRES